MERTQVEIFQTQLKDDLAEAMLPLQLAKITLRGLADTEIPDPEIEYAARLCNTALEVIATRIQTLNQQLSLKSTGDTSL
jgi:hypothetical protein